MPKIFRAYGHSNSNSAFALVAALGLVTLVAVDLVLTMQEAEARGCSGTTPAFNASQGRCFRP